MIYSYDIKKENNEEVLILYFDYTYEFGNEFGNQEKQTLLKQIKNYVKNMKIKFSGEKIVIVVGGIAILTLLLGNDEYEKNNSIILENNDNPVIEEIVDLNKTNINNPDKAIEEMKINLENEVKEESLEQEQVEATVTTNSNIQSENITNPSTPTVSSEQETTNLPVSPPEQNTQSQVPENRINVTINRSNGSVITMDLEEYLIGVVGAEMPASFNTEALKAQAIVARTYTLKRIKNNQPLTDTVSTQVYKDNNQLRSMWGVDFDKYYNKVKNAVESTNGLYITYNGEYIDAVYHAASNGKTEDSIYVWGNNIPYLKSVDSSWDIGTTPYLRTEVKDFNVILNILGVDLNTSDFEILEKNASGRITSVRMGANTYSGVELRNLLGLRSADFDLSVENNNLVITTRGYGHGVGMSQYGANGMANSGYNYEQILKHYYQGITINKL